MVTQINTALPPGFRLDQYVIERQLSLGGFSIVYLAMDTDGTPVVIKEYLPNSLALRTENEIEPQIAPEHLLAFRYGMQCFFEEARSLVKLMHPNVIRVLKFFRANNTAYMVMRYERGRTLHAYIRKYPNEIRENFIRSIFSRMLNGLREVHAHKLLHLDIKPSNIYLRKDYTPVLLDFGAARQTLLNSSSVVLRPMFTPGFASPEQYGKRDDMGPWSDIYSVGASMFACIANHPPPHANEREKEDTLKPSVETYREQYSVQLLETVDWCLRLDPMERPQSVYSLQKALLRLEPGDTLPVPWYSSLSGRLQSYIKKQ